MFTKLKTSVLSLLLIAGMSIINVNCSKKQTATAAVTDADATETAVSESTAPAAELQKYTGRYDVQSDEISWAEVTVENNRLYGESAGRPKTELIKEGEDKFRVQGIDATITFTRDSQQQVNGLVISYQGYEIKGEKVK